MSVKSTAVGTSLMKEPAASSRVDTAEGGQGKPSGSERTWGDDGA